MRALRIAPLRPAGPHPNTAPRTEAPIEPLLTEPKPVRRRLTAEERLADMQSELASLKAAVESKALAAKVEETKPRRVRNAESVADVLEPGTPHAADSDIDADCASPVDLDKPDSSS